MPVNTLSEVIERLIEKGGKYVPHVGEILGQCRGSMEPTTSATDVWTWAGFTLAGFEKLPTSAKRLWGERWAARMEAKARAAGRPVPSSQFIEPLDDVLFRLGLDSRGGLIDMDPLGLDGAKHVEYHAPSDTRGWREIHDEHRALRTERIGDIIAKYAERRAIQEETVAAP